MNEEERIHGERTSAHGLLARTTSGRLYRTVAVGLLACVTLAFAAWYVSHVRASAAEVHSERHPARAVSGSELKLPPLGSARMRPTAVVPVLGADGEGMGSATPAVQGGTAPHAPDDSGTMPLRSVSDRRSARDAAPVLVRNPTLVAPVAPVPESGSMPSWAGPLEGSDLAGLVAGRAAPAAEPRRAGLVDAAILPERRFLLPRGSFLDCTLETAIDSTLPGLATCILATDVYGADGRVVLMERGTRLIGETKSDVRSGQNRVAVVWQDARTPAGVSLDLSSAATDALGRAGVPGQVDRHLADRFGAAVLLSFVDAAASAVAARHEAPGAIVYNPQASRDIATEALRGSINIPPTIRVGPGTRIQVIVATDVSFRGVYHLVAHDPG